MSQFTILLGGTLVPTGRLRRQVADTRVIAADSGMKHAAPLGLAVELWVGDFDSASAELQALHAAVERRTFPTGKDKTDGELAVDAALALGATELVLVGGFGGQADHALAHVMLVLRLARRGIPAFLTSGEEEAVALLAGSTQIELSPGERCSIIAFADLVDLTLEGVEWPLDRRFVPLGSTLTLSNSATGRVSIELGSGHGLIIFYPREPR